MLIGEMNLFQRGVRGLIEHLVKVLHTHYAS